MWLDKYIVHDYDETLDYVLRRGCHKLNKRTGIGTTSCHNINNEYCLLHRFPLLTRRKINYKACFAELLWFLSGSTSLDDLADLGCKYWDQWRSEEFENKNGYGAGQLGPIYGFQLRNFGGVYGKGGTTPGMCDQLYNLIRDINADPSDRGLIVQLWNPAQNSRGRLRPCAFQFQILIDDNGHMDLILTQRSADLPVGVPYNICFYSALLLMIAQQTNYTARHLFHNIGDAHIYNNQMEGVWEYLDGDEQPDSPTIEINKAPDIFSYKMEDFVIQNYNPVKNIKIPVAT